MIDYYARMKLLPEVDVEHFWSNAEKTATCWLWRGTLFQQGYGRYGSYKAHRIAWKLTHGDVPRGRVVCHRCDTKNCVRPDHLFIGTQGDNSRDSAQKGRQPGRSRWNQCLRGHDLTDPNNIYYWQKTKAGKLRRHCKRCVRASQKERGYR